MPYHKLSIQFSQTKYINVSIYCYYWFCFINFQFSIILLHMHFFFDILLIQFSYGIDDF